MKYFLMILIAVPLLVSCSVFKKSGDDDDNDTPAETVAGTGATGQVPYCDSDGQVDCIVTGDFKAVDLRSITIGNYSSGVTIGGVTIGACSGSGQTDCIATAALPAIQSTELDPAVIADGVTIGDVEGTATVGYDANVFSTAFRTVGTTQVSIATEAGSGSTPSESYRDRPLILSDDDGNHASSPIIKGTQVAHPLCGQTGDIPTRIADCNVNWDGETNGSSGEGSWSLVSSDATYEVWRDDRTGFLWSDRIGYNSLVTTDDGDDFTVNWCLAAGSSSLYEDDPNDICDTGTACVGASQACQHQATPESWCTDASIGAAMKGGLDDADGVYWRLPTINDWQMANINGIRFVLPNMGYAFWSASVVSYNRNDAWYFTGDSGYVFTSFRTNELSLRCLGR